MSDDSRAACAAYWETLRGWGALTVAACRRETETGEARAERREADVLWEQAEQQERACAESGIFLPLAYVKAAMALDRFAGQCLALSFLPELDRELGAAYVALEPGGLSVSLALRMLGGPGLPDPLCFRALEEDGPLLADCMEEGGTGDPARILRPARRIREFVLAGSWDDPGVPGLTLCQPDRERPVPPELAELAGRMDAFLAGTEGRNVTFLLRGSDGAGRRTLARAVCARRGEPLLMADGWLLTGEGGAAFGRSVLRECRLQQCPVCFAGLDGLLAERDEASARILTELLDQAAAPSGVSFLSCGEETQTEQGPENWLCVPVTLRVPEAAERRRLWADILACRPVSRLVDPDELAGKYRFTPGPMEKAAAAAETEARWRGLEEIDGACLARGCRSQLRHTLGERARRIETAFTWEELILPDYSKALLRSACDQIRHRPQVLGDWDFGRRLAYGAGLSMLFSGPPGTGKTMAAQIAAEELGLELYKVDLSAVVSKYVGETEKNLSEIFREAARSQAVLFFDEADVLFGKRTEIRDAHDKYNNMEAAYLLQKIEEYDGVSVLATNFVQNFDEAFRRRLKFIIEFPFPDAVYRLKLWRAVFPPRTPLEPDIDWEYLAERFELSGSGIKNAAVNAAYLAAGEEKTVGMPQILTALKRELMKNGKLLRREDFGEYYMLVE